MTRLKAVGRFGTLCGVLGIVMLTAGCPFNNACNNVDCDDNNPCTNDTCSGGVCSHSAINDCCETAQDCNDNNPCTVDVCSNIENGAGTCVNTAVGQNCCNGNADCETGETCVNNQCLPPGVECDSDDDCAADEVCDTTTGQCVAETPECATAADCSDSDGCTTDACTDGVCTHTAVDCPAGEVCVGDGECVPTCTANADCADDGDPCTEVACVAGACVTTTNDCNDDVACTTDACDPATGDCSHTDNCPTGTCNLTTGECTGCVADVDCDDLLECTTDTCTDGACSHTNNTAACSDGNACTTNDVCADGTCAGTAVVCGPGQTCNATTGNCQDITCASNAECNDNFSCTTDTCNLGTGACEYTNINSACEDNLFCTGPLGTDVCDPTDPDAEAGTGCVRLGNTCLNPTPICQESNDSCIGCTTAAQCNDDIPCTSDTCDIATGACTNLALNSSCPDPLKCDGDDICAPADPDADANGCIQPGNPCDPIGKVCNEASFIPGDLNTCTTCVSNADCTDNISCTEDVCAGAPAVCSHTPKDTLCPDTLFCDGDDVCDPNDPDSNPATGCVNGLEFAGYPCPTLANPNAGACNEANNTCFICTSDLNCSDGIGCTDDSCNGGVGTCNHVDNCNVGFCNLQTGQCE